MRTGKNASLGLILKDDTVLAFGPDTEFRIDEFLYNPGQGRLRLGTRLSRGTLNYVSGVIAKLKPYQALGVDQFTYYASLGLGHKEQKRSLELFCKEVIPAFA